MIVSGHEMHLYCDGDGCDRVMHHEPWGGPQFAIFCGHSEISCRRQAKKYGWLIGNKLAWCLCPACVKEGRKRK